MSKVEKWMEAASVDLCRELYDRFVMGGWDPQDAHSEAAEIIAQHAPQQEVRELVEAANELHKFVWDTEMIIANRNPYALRLCDRVRAALAALEK